MKTHRIKFICSTFSFIVDDGTSVAIVTQTGSEVRRLLGLSYDQWVCLEAEVRDHGEVFVQQVKRVCPHFLARILSELENGVVTFWRLL